MIKAILLSSVILASNAWAYTSPAPLRNIEIVELESNNPEIKVLEISLEAYQGSNACVAQGFEVSVNVEVVETVLEVYGVVEALEEDETRFCTFIYKPYYQPKTFVVEMNTSKSLDLLFRDVVIGQKEFSYLSYQELPLNRYCDPASTMYLGGTPLFNEATGEFTPLEDYLANRGLDLECKALVD